MYAYVLGRRADREEDNMRLSTEGMAKEIQQLKSENTTLQFENLQMREALEKIRIISSICSDRPNWKSFDEISLLTKEAIKNTPHTDQLAKQREADLKVIEAAKNVQCSCELASRLSGHNIDCTTWPMYEALDERERVYKGEI